MPDHIEIKSNGEWVFHGEDSRLKRGREDKQWTGKFWNQLTQQFEWGVLDRIYCMNCGTDGGLSARTAVYVKYLCDDCFKRCKPENFSPMPPDEEYRWRMGLPPADSNDKKVIVGG